eukprot:6104718-Prymnesium_polylepis.1
MDASILRSVARREPISDISSEKAGTFPARSGCDPHEARQRALWHQLENAGHWSSGDALAVAMQPDDERQPSGVGGAEEQAREREVEAQVSSAVAVIDLAPAIGQHIA